MMKYNGYYTEADFRQVIKVFTEEVTIDPNTGGRNVEKNECTVLAYCQPVKGKEVESEDQVQNRTTYDIVVLWKQGLIKPGDKVVHVETPPDGQEVEVELRVLSVINKNQTYKNLVIEAMEVGE